MQTTEETREETAPAPAPRQYPERTGADRNTIYIGKKNAMAYVLAAVTQLNTGANEIKLKARGHAISRAVDTEEIIKNRFFPSLKIQQIVLSTEDVTSEDGRPSKVSSIEITLTK
ncbi:TPA: DNA-binding protein Alba [Candidatus Micrarchaeota archaeon]|nr:DNA-binding protein Alba [Candidatus Micrarchaeota archaeon]